MKPIHWLQVSVLLRVHLRPLPKKTLNYSIECSKTIPVWAFTFHCFLFTSVFSSLMGFLVFLYQMSSTLSNQRWFMVCLPRETEKGSLWYPQTIVAPGALASNWFSSVSALEKMHLLNLKDQLLLMDLRQKWIGKACGWKKQLQQQQSVHWVIFPRY